MLAVGDLLCGGDNRIGLLGVQLAQVLVYLRACRLEQAEGADLLVFQAAARNGEVLNCTLGLCAPQCINRHLHFAHRVVLNAVLLFSHI